MGTNHRSLGIALLFVIPVTTAVGQSNSDLAAFSALITSPIGALPPGASDNGRPTPDGASLAINYGRWRYDIDDAIHHNVGVTLARRIGSSRTSVSVTGAYLSLSCDCSGWTSGGVSVSSVVWNSAPSARGAAAPTAHAALELAAGGARYMGEGHASTYSLIAVLDLGGGMRVRGSSRFAISIFPGVGWGHLTSADERGQGTRPLIGGAASWRFPRGVSLDFGAQRVVLTGGPTQFGGGLSWHAS